MQSPAGETSVRQTRRLLILVAVAVAAVLNVTSIVSYVRQDNVWTISHVAGPAKPAPSSGRCLAFRLGFPESAAAWFQAHTNLGAVVLVHENGGVLFPLRGVPLDMFCARAFGAAMVEGETAYIVPATAASPQRPRTYTVESRLSLAPLVFVATAIFLIALRRSSLARVLVAVATTVNARARLAALLFGATLVVRLLYIVVNPRLSFGGVSVGGVPFSDAQLWYDLAANIASGKGMTGPWAGRTPFLPYLLATVMTWTGPSLLIPKLVNATADAASAALIFLVCDRVFNRWVALAASLAFTSSALSMNYSSTVMAEPLGLALILVSLYALMTGIEAKSTRRLFGAGIALGLANLTRPLTILGVPALALCILAAPQKSRISRRRAVVCACVFLLGVALSLAPWVARQRMTFGITSLSDATAVTLYAATTPRYGMWTGQTDAEASNDGITSIPDRYRYYTEKALHNIAADPSFFITNVASSVARYVNFLDRNDRAFSAVYVLFVLGVFALACSSMRGPNGLVWPALSLALALGLYYGPGDRLTWIFVVGGVALSLIGARKRDSLIVAVTLLFTGLALGLVGGDMMSRVFLSVQWAFQAYYLYATFRIFELLSREESDDFSIPAVPDAPGRIIARLLALGRIGIAAVLVLVAAGTMRIGYLTFIRTPPSADRAETLTPGARDALLRRVAALASDLVDAAEVAKSEAIMKPVAFKDDVANHGKLFVGSCGLGEYRYYFGAGQYAFASSVLFSPRPYERTIVRCAENYWVVIPGSLPAELRSMTIVGRQHVSPGYVFEGRIITEAIAFVPAGSDHIVIANEPMHAQLLRWLKPA